MDWTYASKSFLAIRVQDDPGILWKQSIDAALASTQKAFQVESSFAMWKRNRSRVGNVN